jgi:hypothetical protein
MRNYDVFWAYGQCSDVPGDFIKKPMQECTGAEMFAELLDKSRHGLPRRPARQLQGFRLRDARPDRAAARGVPPPGSATRLIRNQHADARKLRLGITPANFFVVFFLNPAGARSAAEITVILAAA